MIVTWWTASGIILHHRSNAYELFTYCSPLIYFSVATVTITTKHQKYYFCYRYRYFHTTLLLNTLLQILSYPGVAELTTQLLILENILWLTLCRINKFGLILYPRKLLRSPILVGYQDYFLAPLSGSIALFFESLGIYICWSLWGTWKTRKQKFILNYEGR